MKHEKQIKSVFEANKGIEEVFVTDDGQVFLTRAFADAHAVKDGGKKRDKALKVTKISREDVFKKKTKTDNKTNEDNGGADETQKDNGDANETKTGNETNEDNGDADEQKQQKNVNNQVKNNKKRK